MKQGPRAVRTKTFDSSEESESEGMEDAISYYSKEVDDLLGDISDVEEKKKKKPLLGDEEDDVLQIDIVADHRCNYFY